MIKAPPSRSPYRFVLGPFWKRNYKNKECGYFCCISLSNNLYIEGNSNHGSINKDAICNEVFPRDNSGIGTDCRDYPKRRVDVFTSMFLIWKCIF